jgi:hypothetical protein
LQIVEEQNKRMFRAREHSNESPQDELEPALGVLQWKVGNGRRLSDDELQFRNQVHNEPAVRTQRIMKRIAPAAQRPFAPAQEGADKALKGLCER